MGFFFYAHYFTRIRAKNGYARKIKVYELHINSVVTGGGKNTAYVQYICGECILFFLVWLDLLVIASVFWEERGLRSTVHPSWLRIPRRAISSGDEARIESLSIYFLVFMGKKSLRNGRIFPFY